MINETIEVLKIERDALASEMKVQADKVRELEAELAAMRARKDGAYEERNRVVALFARLLLDEGSWNVGIAKTDIEGWDDEWKGCVYVEHPTGARQWSWHYHDTHAHLFEGLPAWTGMYDGHTTEMKYQDMERLGAVLDFERKAGT